MTIGFDELIRDNVKVELEYIGEGWSGDYNPDDPDDEALLRFSIYRREADEWREVEDASYCTRLPDSITEEQSQRALEIIMREVYDSVHDPDTLEEVSVKRTCEHLSWIGLSDLEPKAA